MQASDNAPYLGPGTTKVMLALLELHRRGGHVTIRSLADEAGTSISRVHHHLKRLRDAGLVDWKDRAHGTLRPLVEAV